MFIRLNIKRMKWFYVACCNNTLHGAGAGSAVKLLTVLQEDVPSPHGGSEPSGAPGDLMSSSFLGHSTHVNTCMSREYNMHIKEDKCF